jgi:hypothetical protein
MGEQQPYVLMRVQKLTEIKETWQPGQKGRKTYAKEDEIIK